MDTDQGKLFIGGISWETTEEKLKDYFQGYGEVVETVIMKDRTTGRARGFGFVVFADPSVADRVLLDKHTIDGRVVEAKKAVPRDEQHSLVKTNGSVIGPAGHTTKTKKIFVGGLGSNVTEDDFKKYFEQFGNITDVVVMYDHATQRPRGFGFITFDSEEAVDNVLQKTFHELKEKMVEVKRAVPKELSAGPVRSPGGGFSGAPRPGYGAYGPGYASSPGGAYAANRYSPTPGIRGGYPSYGAAGYGAAGYGASGGYGAVGTGYGASAGYGYGGGYGAGAGGAYGGYAGAPGAAGGYGAGGPGYGSAGGGSPGYGGGRNAWGGGPGYGAGSAGYGSGSGNMSGYGNSGWGSGSAGGQGTGSSPGYSGGGYGYGGSDGSGYASPAAAYGGRGGGYGSSAGYGASAGGSGSAGTYGSSAYGDAYGSSGYPDNTWRAGSVDGYGSGGMGGGGGAAGTNYGMGNNAGGAGADGTGNGAGYASYGATSRQSQRGPDARFRPYPATADHSS